MGFWLFYPAFSLQFNLGSDTFANFVGRIKQFKITSNGYSNHPKRFSPTDGT
jgi:hypothetical protein